jgi:hypothetical protein
VTIAIAAVGVVYYLTARAKVQEVLDAAEESSGMDDLVPEKER